MVTIHSCGLGNPIVRTSKNLRAILTHFRIVGAPTTVICVKQNWGKGSLVIEWPNFDHCCVTFESYEVLCNWVKARRILRDVKIEYRDRDLTS